MATLTVREHPARTAQVHPAPLVRAANPPIADTMRGRYLYIVKTPETFRENLREQITDATAQEQHWKTTVKVFDNGIRVLIALGALLALVGIIGGITATVIASHGAALPFWLAAGAGGGTVVLSGLVALIGLKEAPLNFFESFYTQCITDKSKTEYLSKRMTGIREEYASLCLKRLVDIRRDLRELQINISGKTDDELRSYLPALAVYNYSSRASAEYSRLHQSYQLPEGELVMPPEDFQRKLLALNNALKAKADIVFAYSVLKNPEIVAMDRFIDVAEVTSESLRTQDRPFITFKGGMSGRPITINELADASTMGLRELSRRIRDAAPAA